MTKPELDLSCFSYLASARVLKIAKYPQPNSGAEITEVTESIAADGTMVSGAASRLGLRVGFVGNNVGGDNEGKAILKYFKRNNVTHAIKANRSIKTPFIAVFSDNDGNREWFSYISDARRDLEHVNAEVIQKSALAYIDCYTITQTAALRAVDIAQKSQVAIFLNLGGDPLTSELTASLHQKGITIVQTNLEEEKHNDAERLTQEIFDAIKPEIAIVTMGTKGAIARTSASYEYAHAYPIEVKHVHGAGAAFSAGIAFGYLQEWPLNQSLQFACALGSMSCTVEHGFDTFSAEDVKQFIGNWIN